MHNRSNLRGWKEVQIWFLFFFFKLCVFVITLHVLLNRLGSSNRTTCYRVKLWPWCMSPSKKVEGQFFWQKWILKTFHFLLRKDQEKAQIKMASSSRQWHENNSISSILGWYCVNACHLFHVIQLLFLGSHLTEKVPSNNASRQVPTVIKTMRAIFGIVSLYRRDKNYCFIIS